MAGRTLLSQALPDHLRVNAGRLAGRRRRGPGPGGVVRRSPACRPARGRGGNVGGVRSEWPEVCPAACRSPRPGPSPCSRGTQPGPGARRVRLSLVMLVGAAAKVVAGVGCLHSDSRGEAADLALEAPRPCRASAPLAAATVGAIRSSGTPPVSRSSWGHLSSIRSAPSAAAADVEGWAGFVLVGGVGWGVGGCCVVLGVWWGFLVGVLRGSAGGLVGGVWVWGCEFVVATPPSCCAGGGSAGRAGRRPQGLDVDVGRMGDNVGCARRRTAAPWWSLGLHRHGDALSAGSGRYHAGVLRDATRQVPRARPCPAVELRLAPARPCGSRRSGVHGTLPGLRYEHRCTAARRAARALHIDELVSGPHRFLDYLDLERAVDLRLPWRMVAMGVAARRSRPVTAWCWPAPLTGWPVRAWVARAADVRRAGNGTAPRAPCGGWFTPARGRPTRTSSPPDRRHARCRRARGLRLVL